MIKQVIVVRQKYPDGKGGMKKIRFGKLAAQAAHASMKVFFDRGSIYSPVYGIDISMTIGLTEEMRDWVAGAFTKVVVGCDNEEELLELRDKAKDAHIPHALIQDSGKTEFGGVPTYTTLAIGPAEGSKIDAITGHLKLL